MNTTEFSSKSSSLGIRAKLLFGFSITILIFVIATIVTFIIIGLTKEYATRVSDVQLPTYDLFIDLSSEIYESQLAESTIVLTNDVKYEMDLKKSWDNIAVTETDLDILAKNWQTDFVIKWQEIKDLLAALKLNQAKIIAAISSNDKTFSLKSLFLNSLSIAANINQQLNVINANEKSAKGLLDIQSDQLHTGTQEIVHDLSLLQIMTVALTIFGIVLSIIIALITARGILRHINIFRRYTSRVASGDLTQEIQLESSDEMGELASDLNAMTSSLSLITTEIIQACQTMVVTVDEVRQSVDVQSSGAAEQASSINEITSSLTEIEKSSRQTMEKAQMLGSVAERTEEKGQMGLDAVDQSINGMKDVRSKVQMIAQTILDLSNKTQQVGEITAAVNNLAQQSKMLALNASIEAAKAGEAGKGFSVVAVEVKNLAEKSEQATVQVQKILEDIRHATEKAVLVTEEGTKGVDQGTEVVEQTGEIIRGLNVVIHEVAIASQQIEAAVRQEGAGIEQITVGMNEINQVTASFTVSVHQTTEAMKNLANMAKKLKSFVETYKL